MLPCPFRSPARASRPARAPRRLRLRRRAPETTEPAGGHAHRPADRAGGPGRREVRRLRKGRGRRSSSTTDAFVAAVKTGDVEKAKSLYARPGWAGRAIEPVAESFGDLDPRIDLREADLETGQTWTGWHRIEKALWGRPATPLSADRTESPPSSLTDLASCRAGADRRDHRRPDRQRRQGAARRGRHRQGHR